MLRYPVLDGANLFQTVTKVFELTHVIEMLPGREHTDSPKIRDLHKRLFEMKMQRFAS
jgi:hypothetical protein